LRPRPPLVATELIERLLRALVLLPLDRASSSVAVEGDEVGRQFERSADRFLSTAEVVSMPA
jgi:hypothetical protein